MLKNRMIKLAVLLLIFFGSFVGGRGVAAAIAEKPPTIPTAPVLEKTMTEKDFVAPQTETMQDLIIPSDGQEPALIADTSGKIAVEGKIIQLEQKVNQLIYLNAILLLLIVVTAGSFGIVKIRKKLLSTIEVEPR